MIAGMLDAGEVRKRLRQTIEAAKREAAARRVALASEQQAFDAFLENHAVPVLRHVASALKAEGHVFQVLTPAGVLDREKQLGVVQELTDIVTAAAGDPSLRERTWVLLTESPEGGWGIAGHANTNADIAAAARAALVGQ